MQTSAAGSLSLKPRHGGFTLLELLVVLAIVALATAGVSLTLRDASEVQLEREAQRLGALLDAARARSRLSGQPVTWRASADGFRFDGLSPPDLPQQWLDPDTEVLTTAPLLLGPEPVIGPQTLELVSRRQPQRRLTLASDGVRPFAIRLATP